MEEYKRLKRELVHHGSIIDYYKDTILVPNGNVVKWDYIEHKGAAAVVPVREDGKILLVRQYRTALERETLEIPAGGLNSKDEPMIEAAARELREETGYTCGKLEELLSLRTTVAFCNERIDVFLAKDLKESDKLEQDLDEDENINVEAYSVSDLLDMIYSGKMQDSKTVSSILAYVTKYR